MDFVNIVGARFFIFKLSDLKNWFWNYKGLAWFKMAVEYSQVTFSKPFKDINIDSCFYKIKCRI